MVYYGKIDITEEIDVEKKNTWKECIICHCWYISDKEVNSQPSMVFKMVAMFEVVFRMYQ